MSRERVVAVIPARYGSTRFPGKPLAEIAGKPMIQWVYECAAAAECIDEVLVATDDTRIVTAVAAFAGKAVMTSADHQTGTDRIAEVVRDLGVGIVVNVQGDEPAFPPAVLDDLVRAMQSSGAEMGTVAVPFLLSDSEPTNPNAVKVVVDAEGYALYFSRALIPYCRAGGVAVEPLLHWGVYAYTKEFLGRFVAWPRGQLEACEMLEQLRALERGTRIFVVRATSASVGVDVPEDIPRAEVMLRELGRV